jgi:Ca2+-binding EF-hand superfamily protein
VGADGADAVQEIFNQLDTHGNGVISESEFLAFSRQTLDDLDGLGDDRGTRTR